MRRIVRGLTHLAVVGTCAYSVVVLVRKPPNSLGHPSPKSWQEGTEEKSVKKLTGIRTPSNGAPSGILGKFSEPETRQIVRRVGKQLSRFVVAKGALSPPISPATVFPRGWYWIRDRVDSYTCVRGRALLQFSGAESLFFISGEGPLDRSKLEDFALRHGRELRLEIVTDASGGVGDGGGWMQCREWVAIE